VVRLDVPMHLIQSIRLVHAVMESGAEVCVAPEDAEKFAHLRRYFRFRYRVGAPGAARPAGAVVDHERPLTRVGALGRPLIFPRGMARRCRAAWPATRTVRVLFCGLVTPARYAVLRDWLQRAGAGRALLDGWQALAAQPEQAHWPRPLRDRASGVWLWASARGRRFPVKAWDEAYYRLLARARFVLCPNGDFVWTYRFFEAALCGAIPIVEDDCRVYHGFRYHRIAEEPSRLVWSAGAARENYALALRRLTVERGEMARALANAVASAQRRVPG